MWWEVAVYFSTCNYTISTPLSLCGFATITKDTWNLLWMESHIRPPPNTVWVGLGKIHISCGVFLFFLRLPPIWIQSRNTNSLYWQSECWESTLWCSAPLKLRTHQQLEKGASDWTTPLDWFGRINVSGESERQQLPP